MGEEHTPLDGMKAVALSKRTFGKNKGELDEFDERWCQEYLIDFDAPNAAKRAGESLGRATRRGLACLRRPEIQARLQELAADLMRSSGLTPEKIIDELARLGFSNMDDYVERTSDGGVRFKWDKVTRAQMAAVAEITVEEFMDGKGDDARPVRKTKMRLHSKREALVDLGKIHGIYKDPDTNVNIALLLTKDEMNA